MFHQFAIGMERQLSTSFVASADVIGSVGRNITLLRNLNQPANGNGARPYPNFGAIQYRDHAGESRYRGAGSLARKAIQQGPQLSRVLHDWRSARQHAGAPVGSLTPSAEHERSRRLGRARRQRHPPSIRRQLHRESSARAAPDRARLARGRHPDGSHRPAVHRHARQSRGRGLGAESRRGNRGPENRRQLVQRVGFSGRPGRHIRQRRHATFCAGPAG